MAATSVSLLASIGKHWNTAVRVAGTWQLNMTFNIFQWYDCALRSVLDVLPHSQAMYLGSTDFRKLNATYISNCDCFMDRQTLLQHLHKTVLPESLIVDTFTASTHKMQCCNIFFAQRSTVCVCDFISTWPNVWKPLLQWQQPDSHCQHKLQLKHTMAEGCRSVRNNKPNVLPIESH